MSRQCLSQARRSFRQSSQKLQALLEIVPKAESSLQHPGPKRALMEPSFSDFESAEVHEAVEVAMQKLADLVKSYAKSGSPKSGFHVKPQQVSQFQH